MRRLLPWLSCALALTACKDPETQANDQKAQTERHDLSEGRRALASGQYDRAVHLFQAAASSMPNDPNPLLLLSEAHHEAGNDDAAILALKQASSLSRGGDAQVKKQLADLYQREGYINEAVDALVELRDLKQLDDSELLNLARLQSQMGKSDEAFRTLERVQSARPDDPDAKVVQAEILLSAGDETDAVKIADRLLQDHPDLVSARMLRARTRLNAGRPEAAEEDLDAIAAPEASRADVVELKARVLSELKRYDEAEAALSALVESEPNNVEALAYLADAKLNLGEATDADQLLDKATGLKPSSPGVLFVRGRSLELAGDLKGAISSYKLALKADPRFAPALRRVWSIDLQEGNDGDALTALERLYFANEAGLEEKATLVELCAKRKIDTALAKKIIEEVIRAAPSNERYRRIQLALGGGPTRVVKHATGPEIIRGGFPPAGARRHRGR